MEIGQSISDIREKYSQQYVDIVAIDNNNDGKFNYGKKFGDTIKIFDWENKKSVGYHLIKEGEVDVIATAGNVEITKTSLGQSLKKTFKGLTEKEIKQKFPNSILVNPDGKNTFDPGSTIIFKGADGTRHNIHYVKNGELPAETLKLTGAKNLNQVKSDRGILANDVVWYDTPNK